MAIELKKPGRRTKGGNASSAQPAKKVQDIYDVRDSNWDQLDVPLDNISPNPFNDRAMGDLDELAADIAKDGLDSPVLVMHTSVFVEYWGDRFPEECAKLETELLLGFGERRWRASMIAAEETGLTTIRGILRNDAVPKIRRLLIRENYHRLNPTPLERARHIRTLSVEEGLSYAEICDELNIKSRGTISKLLDLLELPNSVQAAVQEGTITQTGALQLGDLDEEQVQVALHLVVDEDMKPADAVHYARTAPPAVSQGNTPPLSDRPEAEQKAVDTTAELEIEPTIDAAAEAADEDSPKAAASADSSTSTPARATTGRTPAKTAAKDQTATDRAVAARERDLACVEWLQSSELPTAEQFGGLVRRALLVGGKLDGRSKAHAWLVRSGKAHFDIKDADGYYGAVLSSGDDELIQRATWAIALAGNEVRAADRRRPGWDAHDAAHVRELMTVVGYKPTTSWETTELDRLGVSLGNSLDHSEQESA